MYKVPYERLIPGGEKEIKHSFLFHGLGLGENYVSSYYTKEEKAENKKVVCVNQKLFCYF